MSFLLIEIAYEIVNLKEVSKKEIEQEVKPTLVPEPWWR